MPGVPSAGRAWKESVGASRLLTAQGLSGLLLAFLTREALSEIARVTVTNLGMVNQGVFLPETLLT